MRSTGLLVAPLTPVLLNGAEPPGKVLDLSHWLLTLPVDTARSGSPDVWIWSYERETDT